MATQQRNPTSEVSVTGTWSGTNRHLLLDDHPDSANADNTTCSANGVAVFGFSVFTVPTGASNISVQVLYYDFKNGTQSCTIGGLIRCNDTTNQLSATHNPGNGVGNIALRTENYATNPKSGAAWTVDDVNGVGTNGLTAFGLSVTDASPTITVSSIQLQVTYDPPDRRAHVSYAELGVPDPPVPDQTGSNSWNLISWDSWGSSRNRIAAAVCTSLFLSQTGTLPGPSAGERRAQVSFAELEVPELAKRVHISFAELEVPDPVPGATASAGAAWNLVTWDSWGSSRNRIAANVATSLYLSQSASLPAADVTRRGQVSWAELETANAPRRAQISWAEIETANAPRRANVSWGELETPNAPRRSQISWAKLKTGNAPRRAQLSWAELETPDPLRRAQVSFAELEVPDALRRAQISFAELETSDAPRRAQISFAEFEIPTAPRRAHVSLAELETADAPRRANISFAELEVPDVGEIGRAASNFTLFKKWKSQYAVGINYQQGGGPVDVPQLWGSNFIPLIQWANAFNAAASQFNLSESGGLLPTPPEITRRAHVSFAELEVPTAPRRAQVSFAEFETPDALRRAHISWAELETADALRGARISFAELEVPNGPRRAHVSFAELETANAPRRAQISFAELETGNAPRRVNISWAELETPNAERRAHVSFAEFEVPEHVRMAHISWAELETPDAVVGGVGLRVRRVRHWHRIWTG